MAGDPRIVERILTSLAVVFGAITLVFLILHWLPGDPAELIADASRARSILGWIPQFPEIQTIAQHAWKWHSSRETH